MLSQNPGKSHPWSGQHLQVRLAPPNIPKRFVRHDLLDMNPCCEGLMSLLSVKCETISSRMMASITLQSIHVREIGL